MTSKKSHHYWDREKKIHKIVKGTDKVAKHRKSLYNMLSDPEDSDNVNGEVGKNYGYHGNNNFTKRR